MKKGSKKATACAVLGAIALAGAGTMAVFTDSAEGDASVTAGTLDMQLAQEWATDNSDTLTTGLLPGEKLDMPYEITNVGSKSMDVRETFVITAPEGMTFPNADFFSIYTADAADDTDAATGKFVPAGAKLQGELSADSKTITFKPAQFSLNGDPATGTAQETVDGVTSNVYNGNYVVVFDYAADNAWLGKDVVIDYFAEAKQHENTHATDWTKIGAASYTLNGEAANLSTPTATVN